MVDSKQSHTKCSDTSKKFAASIYWVEEKAVLEKSDQDVATEGPVIQGKHSSKMRLCASISKMTKEHVLVKVTNDKAGDKKGYQVM